ncbi:MAG: type II toxin-antitoxin system PemK/MazF family toxin [Euryarchaeota archaeon]|nr:type II toxin-antitoxin system PemK/MazF family toxin [Euryarchaeota archaeon]
MPENQKQKVFKAVIQHKLRGTNLRRASLPSCVSISSGEGGLASDSVALCHQLRVLDKSRLQRKLGTVSQQTLSVIESRMRFSMGII